MSECRGVLNCNFKQKTVSITELSLNSGVSGVMLSVEFFVILSVIMPNVVMLSVVVPLIATLIKRQSA